MKKILLILFATFVLNTNLTICELNQGCKSDDQCNSTPTNPAVKEKCSGGKCIVA